MAGWKPSQLKVFGDANIVKLFNIERQKVDEDTDNEKAELRQKIMIVPEEGVKIAALNVKQDLEDLWNLVKKRFSSTQPTKDMDRMLWTKLKRIFEPDPKDEGLLTLMLCEKLIVDHECEMAFELLKFIQG
ncbi:hypothetical protein Tco_0769089 [Tanacetum coccineum]|uniref:Uncharacterized protein n=1 Tax=Tanacetum coccineum TaxID=301880 RepID=A0ABQ4ZC73_9ASTR